MRGSSIEEGGPDILLEARWGCEKMIINRRAGDFMILTSTFRQHFVSPFGGMAMVMGGQGQLWCPVATSDDISAMARF